MLKILQIRNIYCQIFDVSKNNGEKQKVATDDWKHIINGF